MPWSAHPYKYLTRNLRVDKARKLAVIRFDVVLQEQLGLELAVVYQDQTRTQPAADRVADLFRPRQPVVTPTDSSLRLLQAADVVRS